MSKVWIFRETGEIRPGNVDEWVLSYEPFKLPWESTVDFRILSLKVFDVDPIREVYEKYKDLKKVDQGKAMIDFWQAIKRYMEGK